MEPGPFLSAGEYIGYRLKQLGVTHVFCVPGDFNLPLLDSLASVPGLTIVNCASELGCAYASDGQSRAVGLGCCVTTFLVGALSAINGVAGSYAEGLPVIHLVGVPSTKEYNSSAPYCLHHTLGNGETMSQEVDCYKPVTCYQSILRSFTDARYLIDKAFNKALTHSKPVLLEVCRDIPFISHPSFGRAPPHMTPFPRPSSSSNPEALAVASQAIATFLNSKKLPVIIAGRQARFCRAALKGLVDTCQYPVAVLVDGKGQFPEDHPCFTGTYFRDFTDPVSVREMVEASDGLLLVGTHFNELAWGPAPDEAFESKAVLLYKGRAVVGLSDAFTSVNSGDLLAALTQCLKPNSTALDWFRTQPAVPPSLLVDPEFTAPAGVPLKLDDFYSLVQNRLLHPSSRKLSLEGPAPSSDIFTSSSSKRHGMHPSVQRTSFDGGSLDGETCCGTPRAASLTSPTSPGAAAAAKRPRMVASGLHQPAFDVMVDTGDSLLRLHTLKLTAGAAFETQIFAGNIGWAPAAGLGFSLAAQAAGRRLLLVCGDGGLQMTASEIGNHPKFGSNAIMVVVNNDGYLIERYISPKAHSGYNYTKRWNHTMLAEAMCNGEGKYKIMKVTNETEALAALECAAALTDHFIFIEVVVDKRDAARGAGAFRAGFMAAHFAHMPAYKGLLEA